MAKKAQQSFDEKVDAWTRYLHSELLRGGGPALRAAVFKLLSTESQDK